MCVCVCDGWGWGAALLSAGNPVKGSSFVGRKVCTGILVYISAEVGTFSDFHSPSTEAVI